MEKEGTWSRDLENWIVSSKMEKEGTWSRDLENWSVSSKMEKKEATWSRDESRSVGTGEIFMKAGNLLI